ncbi:hypothetical protein ACIG3E_03770 [Streptomyces sp. NPDC053474]|uniref:hypothetical protein n=1 Tax=Streptomyces sp. NPDC053474 TaxID=3365704 RepID=UPI0037D3E7F1
MPHVTAAKIHHRRDVTGATPGAALMDKPAGAAHQVGLGLAALAAPRPTLTRVVTHAKRAHGLEALPARHGP